MREAAYTGLWVAVYHPRVPVMAVIAVALSSAVTVVSSLESVPLYLYPVDRYYYIDVL